MRCAVQCGRARSRLSLGDSDGIAPGHVQWWSGGCGFRLGRVRDEAKPEGYRSTRLSADDFKRPAEGLLWLQNDFGRDVLDCAYVRLDGRVVGYP